MLIYLFFIFTCGWCVCWLLFLNYQQYTRDFEREERLRQRRKQIKKQMLANGRESFIKLKRSLTVSKHSQQSPSDEGQHSRPEAHRNKLACVNSSGKHYILLDQQLQQPDEACGLLMQEERNSDRDDLSENDYLDEDYLNDEFLSSPLNDELLMADGCQQCAECQQQSHSIDMRGWPDELIDADFDELGGIPRKLVSDEDEPEEDLWPIVRLHENPLNFVGPSSPLVAANSIEDNPRPGESSGGLELNVSEELLLDRSRLLSLQESQRENRAAIRLVSRAGAFAELA